MAVLIIAAAVMVAAGSTLLTHLLDVHERIGLVVSYWLVCAWLTITALLLALFDVIAVRAEARAARKVLREGVSSSKIPNES